MLQAIEMHFRSKSAGRAVVEELLRCGMSVDSKGRIFCGATEIAPAKLARAVGVDRRVVISTAKQIASDKGLSDIFGALSPQPYLGGIAVKLGSDAMEISSPAASADVVSTIVGVLSQHGVKIRQIIADAQGVFPEPKLRIVVDGRLPPAALSSIRKTGLAEKITIR